MSESADQPSNAPEVYPNLLSNKHLTFVVLTRDSLKTSEQVTEMISTCANLVAELYPAIDVVSSYAWSNLFRHAYGNPINNIKEPAYINLVQIELAEENAELARVINYVLANVIYYNGVKYFDAANIKKLQMSMPFHFFVPLIIVSHHVNFASPNRSKFSGTHVSPAQDARLYQFDRFNRQKMHVLFNEFIAESAVKNAEPQATPVVSDN